MDDAKCRALKGELAAQPEPQVVPIARFFDGNDDWGSIGCNLDPHPGVDEFRNVLVGLLSLPRVRAVYAQISEADPGEGCWPFADTVLVVGDITPAELSRSVGVLRPNEVAEADVSSVPPAVASRHGAPACVIWWD